MQYLCFVDFRHGISAFANFSCSFSVLDTPLPPPPPGVPYLHQPECLEFKTNKNLQDQSRNETKRNDINDFLLLHYV